MTARIVVVCQAKGGSGKTTLAINIAASLCRETKKSRVVLIDTDAQQSAVKWSSVSEEVELPMSVVGYAQTTVHKAIQKMVDSFDFIVVDTPPSAMAFSKIVRSALISADLAIVPVLPSPLDLWEAAEIAELIGDINITRETGGFPPLETRMVITRLKPNTVLGNQIQAALNSMKIPVFDTCVKEREIYKRAAVEGCDIFSVRNVSGKKEAVNEITRLTREIKKILQ